MDKPFYNSDQVLGESFDANSNAIRVDVINPGETSDVLNTGGRAIVKKVDLDSEGNEVITYKKFMVKRGGRIQTARVKRIA